MTTTPAQHTRHNHRAAAPARRAGTRVRDTATGLGALLLLLTFVVGIPLILVTVAPVHGWPTTTWSRILASLTRPDDGHLFLAALALIAWVAWSVFALSLVVEATAFLRGLPTPRIPLLGGPQRLAATLVAGAALLLPTPTTPALPPTGAPTAAVALLDTAAITPVAPTPASHRPASALAQQVPAPAVGSSVAPVSRHTTHHRAAQRTVTVHRGDTLWSIAETHLGSGTRFREIAQLNYGRPQPDGRTLTDTHWIYPGWTLELPPTHNATATSAPHHATAAPTPAHHRPVREYAVRKGDTLWDIAEDHLGDPERYREIFDLNRGRPQRGGGALTDPDEILVGWVLLLPPHHATAQPHTSTTPAPRAIPASTARSATPPAPEHLLPRPESDGGATVTAVPGTTQAPGLSREAADPGHGTSPAIQDDDATAVDLSRFALGVTALAATGAIAELTRRRRRHQAIRTPGGRIRMPVAETATVERTLRSSNTPLTLTTLQAALARLAQGGTAGHLAMPRIQTITLAPDAIELLVADDAEPPAPFTRSAAHGWTARASDLADLASIPEAHAYPALVSVGVIDDAVFLLNLEAFGTLSLMGEPDLVRDFARTLAVELATSPLSGGVALTLPEWLEDLAEVADPDRVCSTTRDAGARRAHARAAAVRRLLDEVDVDDLSDARARGVAEDAWQPEILITDTATHAEPWSGVCIIRSGRHEGAQTQIVLSDAGATATIPELGVHFRPSRLSDADYKQVLTLLGPPDPEPTSTLAAAELADAETSSAIAQSSRLQVLAALPQRDCTTIDLTATEDGESDSGARPPGIGLLGRPEVVGSTATDTTRRARSIELVAYLAMHPGATAPEIDEALFPGRRVTHDMRNSLVARTRTWLGSDHDGNLHLPLVTGNNGYRLAHGFRCDWNDFLRLARAGLSTDPVDTARLERALRLVRGRPFLGVDPAAYTWAEADTQEMISTIVDVSHELAVAHLSSGDPSAAIDSAARGLLADPANESLHRIAIAAASQRGDAVAVARFEQRLRHQLEDIDPDSAPDTLTIDVLRDVSTGTRLGN